MEKTLLIFDLFGTLVRSPSAKEVEEHLNEIEIYCSAQPGLYERWLLTSNLRDSGYYSTAREYWESVGVVDTEKATTLYYRANSYWLDDLREDSIQTLSYLKEKGYALSLCSNAGFETLSLLKSNGIYPYFDKVTISSEIKALKPNAEMYTASLPEGQTFGRIYFIGDGGSDELSGALKMGFTPIQVSEFKTGGSSLRELEGTHHRINNLEELIKLLDS